MTSSTVQNGIAPFLIGAAFGGAVALLTAPHSGVRTRRLIQRTAEDTCDNLAELGEDLSDRGREFARQSAKAVGS